MTAEAEHGWTLPLFITRRNKYVMGVLLAIVATILYLTTNHIHLLEPRLLPMTWIDRATPFIPVTVWIYVSEYLLFAAVYTMSRDLVNLNRYAYSFLALQTFSVFIFTAWPTTFPRHLFPLPQDLDPLTNYLFSSLRETDTPASCCPSLHVSSVYLSSFMFLSEQRKKFPFFFLWATAIGITTLTTKQHYLVDVITGFLMAVIIYWIFRNLVTYRELQAKR
jgi:membrane-associated phospholipid phosphatase